MSEYDDLIEGYEGLAAEDMGPLTDEENQRLEESVVTARDLMDPIVQVVSRGTTSQIVGPLDFDTPVTATEQHELRALKPDQVPIVGLHYVIYNGRPMPVLRGGYPTSEDEHVRRYPLEDVDAERRERAARTLRQNYRGYLCGELGSL